MWVGGLFLFSLFCATVLPIIFVDTSSIRKCTYGNDPSAGTVAAWCKSDPFDLWFADVFHTTNFAMFWAVVSHVFNFLVAPGFAYWLVYQNLPPGVDRFPSERIKHT